MSAIRIAVVSDLHIDHEIGWLRAARKHMHKDEFDWIRTILTKLDARDLGKEHPLYGPDLRSVREANVDVMLIAGDTHPGTGAIQYADEVARYARCHVVLCAGNHEAYGWDLTALTPALREAAAATEGRVTFLEQDTSSLRIRDRRIVVHGATLWTDFRVHGSQWQGMHSAQREMSDYRKISFGGHGFRPTDAADIHQETRAWLAAELALARQGADAVIIMTHHCPCPEFVAYDRCPPAYVSNMWREINSWHPDLWVWGHTHFPVRGKSGTTLLVSAPRGYLGGFRETWYVEDFVPAIIEL